MRAGHRGLQTALFVLALAAPLSAQTAPTDAMDDAVEQARPPARAPTEPPISFRGFGLVSVQNFAAQTTFEGIFGSSVGLFYGGGAQVVSREGLFGEFSISRFSKTGERAFRFNNQTFRLGIPLTATITPIEASGGYRFRLRRQRNFIPYVAAGVSSYGYHEESVGADSDENLDVRHVGYLVLGGLEYRVDRLIGVAGDVQYTHVGGILGDAGLSQQADEHDLGGVAFRFRVMVGR